MNIQKKSGFTVPGIQKAQVKKKPPRSISESSTITATTTTTQRSIIIEEKDSCRVRHAFLWLKTKREKERTREQFDIFDSLVVVQVYSHLFSFDDLMSCSSYPFNIQQESFYAMASLAYCR